jgi:membrane associated rhomboid family serine protease
MEQKTEVQSLIERGDALLYGGEPREAAAQYAEALQVDRGAVKAHLGLAEANLALGSYGTVYLACREVQTLAPGSDDATLARALLFVLERRYDSAIEELEKLAQSDPGRAYGHALRAYCLRNLGQTYDAQQYEGKARRLSSGASFAGLFPPVQAAPNLTIGPQTSAAPVMPNGNAVVSAPPAPERNSAFERQRQVLRARLTSRRLPSMTYILIAINLVVYILTALSVGGNFYNPSAVLAAGTPVTPTALGVFYYYGIQYGPLMQNNPLEWYRVVTAMFLHTSIAHIGLNMLSLYFVGVATEQLFGRWRFLLIYFVGGVIGGVTQFVLVPNALALGASGAIFAIFGAFGAFVILRRSVLGAAANPIIAQWVFWLLLNLVYGFTLGAGTIGIADHIGGLVSGFALGALLLPSLFKPIRMR